MDKGLAGLLEDFFDEKKSYLKDWCELVITELPSMAAVQDHQSGLDVSVMSADRVPATKEEEVIFLLGSWKTFLIVSSKDMPVPIGPTQCHLTVSCLIKAIRY